MSSRPNGLLIRRCLCGVDLPTEPELAGDPPIAILRCSCGVAALSTDTTAAEVDELYRGEYHASRTRHPGCIPYTERYDHDAEVADLRIETYTERFGEAFESVETALDIGAANGAFVDSLRAIGVEAEGLDPDPAMRGEFITTGTLPTGALSGRDFDLVTLHDVLEHVVDPSTLLQHAATLLSKDGLLIVDVPDVGVPEGAHHYKSEHLWFFTEASLIELFRRAGLALTEIYRPIPGKIVVAGRNL